MATEMTEEEHIRLKEAAEASEPRQKRQAFFDEVFQRATAGNGAGMNPVPLPRRFATFTMEAELCAPGVFPEDFEITLRSLTSSEEYAATRGVTDATRIVGALSKATIYAVNGRTLQSHEIEWLWEAIAIGGRQLVATMAQQVGMADEATLGKALRSLRIH